MVERICLPEGGERKAEGARFSSFLFAPGGETQSSSDVRGFRTPEITPIPVPRDQFVAVAPQVPSALQEGIRRTILTIDVEGKEMQVRNLRWRTGGEENPAAAMSAKPRWPCNHR